MTTRAAFRLRVENVYPAGIRTLPIRGRIFCSGGVSRRASRNCRDSRFTKVRSTWTGAGEPQLPNVGLASDGYFGVYGVGPILGRALAPGDHQKGCCADVACWLQISGARNRERSQGFWGKPLNLTARHARSSVSLPKMVPEGYRPVHGWGADGTGSLPYIEHGTNYLFTVGLLRPASEPVAGAG